MTKKYNNRGEKSDGIQPADTVFATLWVFHGEPNFSTSYAIPAPPRGWYSV